jgi:hypothetical protein
LVCVWFLLPANRFGTVKLAATTQTDLIQSARRR